MVPGGDRERRMQPDGHSVSVGVESEKNMTPPSVSRSLSSREFNFNSQAFCDFYEFL